MRYLCSREISEIEFQIKSQLSHKIELKFTLSHKFTLYKCITCIAISSIQLQTKVKLCSSISLELCFFIGQNSALIYRLAQVKINN